MDIWCFNSVSSYKHTNMDKPDCTGPPMSLSNKFTGETKIPYTYTVKFVVSQSDTFFSDNIFILIFCFLFFIFFLFAFLSIIEILVRL